MYKRIRDLRQKHHMTQKEVAAILRCTQATYSRYERGLTQIPLKVWIALARLYGTSVDYLAELTDIMLPH